MRNQKFKSGDKIGRLTLLKPTGKKHRSYIEWECKCDCGNIIKRASGYIGSTINSCGCLRKENSHNMRWKGYKEISSTFWTNLINHSLRGKNKKRKLEFKITKQYVWNLYIKQNRKCALSGLPIKFSDCTSKSVWDTASLDRIDSTKGYIKGNVQWVHKDINRMKMNHSDDEFIKYCKLVAAYN